MTIVAEEEVLAAAELDLTAESTADTRGGDADASTVATTAEGREPFLVIEKGAPTDEEIAALVCVFAAAAASAGATTGSTGPRDLWGVPTMLHRGTSPNSPYAYPYLSNLRY
ncbi:acyl-CoA carboxylase subunit epsilon [Nocardia paucivorans]|uniref:acyl-CoA carboxylase subunit epsilon n=1 Tax=Nocardia paucivorans TaxID=114259 RepID=UPI000593D5E3|nr:acyl-CoA carboxylase subunit epsilon [Nocardia paucivorans]